MNQREFTFRRSGEYSNAAPIPFDPARHVKRAPRRNAGLGPICPGCGCRRSCANKCECNS